MLALTLAVPAFALEESDVEAAVSSSSREAVTGNVLVWFLYAVGFLKVSQKIDSFMASIGVNVGHIVELNWISPNKTSSARRRLSGSFCNIDITS